MDLLVYDIEIENGIPDGEHPPVEGIRYCKGWDDHANMGIAVVGVYDYVTQRYRVFTKDNFEDFRNLCKVRNNVVGFNNHGFDDAVLKVTPGIEFDFRDANVLADSIDLLSEVWLACGLSPKWGGGRQAGFSLQKLSLANGLPGKTGTGEHAPVLWQQGKIGKVIDYCLNDVWLTKKLIDQCRDVGFLKNPKNHMPMQITRFAKL